MFATTAFAADPVGEPGRSAGKKNPLNNFYFGEQHLHTTTSVDAYIQGNLKNTCVTSAHMVPTSRFT